MDAKAKFEEYLSKKGLRKTEPRQKVVDVFLKTEKHVSTQQLYEIVQKKHKEIGYATVARTLKLLFDAGLCRKVDFGDGTARYEHSYNHEHHDHLVCTKCGKVEEILDTKLEKIQGELIKKYGYQEISHRLDIFGICPQCQK